MRHRAREHASVPTDAMEASVNLAFRCMRAPVFAAALACAGMSGAQAQQRVNGAAAYDAAGLPMAPEDRDAAMHAATNRLEGVGGDPEALLGAPGALDDPYRSAYDTARHGADALAKTQRVPRGALADGRYGPQPAMPGKGKAKENAQPGQAGNDEPLDAKTNKADPGARTPMGSALSIYHGPGDVGKAVGQIYKMPW